MALMARSALQKNDRLLDFRFRARDHLDDDRGAPEAGQAEPAADFFQERGERAVFQHAVQNHGQEK